MPIFPTIPPKYLAPPIAANAPAAVATVSMLFATELRTPTRVVVAPVASLAPPTQAKNAFSILVVAAETV